MITKSKQKTLIFEVEKQNDLPSIGKKLKITGMLRKLSH